MRNQSDIKNLVAIALVMASIFAFAVGVRGGWALASEYFEKKELRKESR